MDLEGIVPNEVSQAEKNKCPMISLIFGIQKTKTKTQNKQTSGRNKAHRYREYFLVARWEQV